MIRMYPSRKLHETFLLGPETQLFPSWISTWNKKLVPGPGPPSPPFGSFFVLGSIDDSSSSTVPLFFEGAIWSQGKVEKERKSEKRGSRKLAQFSGVSNLGQELGYTSFYPTRATCSITFFALGARGKRMGYHHHLVVDVKLARERMSKEQDDEGWGSGHQTYLLLTDCI